MQDSICPKGWGLPINGNDQTTKSWINLLFTSYSLQDNGDSSTSAQKTPLSLVYSGDYDWVNGNLSNRGSNGFFWSSTPYSAAGAHNLYFSSTRLVPQGGYHKLGGLTIRCVVREIVTNVVNHYVKLDNFREVCYNGGIRCNFSPEGEFFVVLGRK